MINDCGLSKMTKEIVKDTGEIFSRIFDHRPFLNGEIRFFLNEFEGKRSDREIEGLFSAVQNTIEIRDSAIERCRLASEIHIPVLKINLDTILSRCEEIAVRKENPTLTEQLEKNREQRKIIWQQFIDDMTHKCSRVDITFEEKEEELREFYLDLERKLHIHK